jgi:predicted acetyltransferase
VPLEIRPITDAEVPAWIETMRSGFLGHAVAGEAEYRRPHLDLPRTFGAFDGDRVVGTLRSFTTTMTVPGARVRCAALTNVTVAATHRRRGLLTSMITRDLTESVERGEIVGALIAAEYPIYGRFGYGPAVETQDLEIATSVTLRDQPDEGTVSFVTGAELREAAPAIYDAVAATVPGAIDRLDHVWDAHLAVVDTPGRPQKPDRFFVLGHDAGGSPDGFAVYHVEDHWDRGRPRGTLHLEELLALDTPALARLWRFCLEVDWIATVKAELQTVDHLLHWLVEDAREVVAVERGDLQWVRLLDAEAALAARRYLAPGAVTFAIDDPLGHAHGTFALDGGPDGAECRRTTATADLALPVGVLSSAYLGGVALTTLHRAGLVDELTPGAVARADAMFRSPVAPACLTTF